MLSYGGVCSNLERRAGTACVRACPASEAPGKLAHTYDMYVYDAQGPRHKRSDMHSTKNSKKRNIRFCDQTPFLRGFQLRRRRARAVQGHGEPLHPARTLNAKLKDIAPGRWCVLNDSADLPRSSEEEPCTELIYQPNPHLGNCAVCCADLKNSEK